MVAKANPTVPITDTDSPTVKCCKYLITCQTELVELHLIIGDLPGRMSDERQEELLQLIAMYAGRDGGQVEEKR